MRPEVTESGRVGVTGGIASLTTWMCLALILLVVYIILASLSNHDLVVTAYRLPSPAEGVRGLRIVHLSDLHGRSFGPMRASG